MAGAALIQPDTAFIRSVIANGGGDLKKCFQCATCSVTCTLSPDEAPFPRRQMIEAQWGLKERLLADPALWLCHNCGDCTEKCPRGARPGDVLGALRREAIKQLAWPGFMGRLVANPAALPLLFVPPVLVFVGMAMWAPRGEPTGEFEFANQFSIPVLEAFFFAIAGFVLLAFLIGGIRLVRGLRSRGVDGSPLAGLAPTLREVMSNGRLTRCQARKSRFRGHLLTMWGFAGLALMGTTVGAGTMAGVMKTPLEMTNPLKIFANLCAAVILVGGTLLLVERLRDPVKRAATTYFDWFFLLTLYGVVLTGILSQFLRLAQHASLMYPVYFVHLVLILVLFLYAPYSKFAHFLYRTVALAAVRTSPSRQAAAAGTNRTLESDTRIPTATT